MEETASLATTMDTTKKSLTQATVAEVLSIRLTSLKITKRENKAT